MQHIAAGLHQAGFQRGEHLAIIGENRPRLYFTMVATQCLGGIPVPLYQDAVAAEMEFVFANAEIGFAVAEDQEQVDKLLEVRETVPQLKRIIYEDPRGLRKYDQAGLASYEQIRALGEQLLKERPSVVDDEIAKGRADDVAAMFYTSGTTGHPKGVVLGYANLLAAGRAGATMEHLTEREEVLAYLPMAWIGQNIFSYTQWLVCGFTVNCPESAATVMADMAVGAYAAYNFVVRVPSLNFLLVLVLSGGVAALVGVLFGIPSLRIKGLYLAVATLAAQFFIDWLFARVKWFTNYSSSGSVSTAPIEMFGWSIETPAQKYLFVLTIAVVMTLAAKNLVRGHIGRGWMAIRDMVVNEDVLVEIVRPGTGNPVPDGEVGEVVVTTTDTHHPWIRLALGDLSAIVPGTSPCGRTNRRIRGWLGRADQITKVKGM